MAGTLVDVTANRSDPARRLPDHAALGGKRVGAAAIAREQLELHYHRVLTGALAGDRAPQRAAVLLGLVAGVQIMRQMIGSTAALADADRRTLVRQRPRTAAAAS